MLELDTDLKQRFKKAARAFKTRLELKPDRWTIRNLITNEKIGYFIKSNRLTTDELTKIVDKGGIWGWMVSKQWQRIFPLYNNSSASHGKVLQ